MENEWINYQVGTQNFKGILVYDKNRPLPLPTVIVAHAWKGQDDFARKKAQFLAELGYAAFAVDLYGDGKTVETNEDAAAMMMPLFIERKNLRERIGAAYETITRHEIVLKEKVGAIGFCFGGLAVLELLRSGAKLKGVVSFHGLLGNRLGENKAKIAPAASRLHGSLLILHGYQDPLVNQEDIIAVQKEFSDANVDWQMHIYGSAAHAFTNPLANDRKNGMVYDSTSERRSLQAMNNFFSEVFQ